MADWYGHARSNYFKVKDETAFRKWAASRTLGVWEEMREGSKYFAVYPDDDYSQFGGWPTEVYPDDDEENGENDEDADEREERQYELDLPMELSQHLADDSVAVLMECGAEKLRYLTGWTIAVNSKGETVRIDLWDINEAAKHLGNEITNAEY